MKACTCVSVCRAISSLWPPALAIISMISFSFQFSPFPPCRPFHQKSNLPEWCDTGAREVGAQVRECERERRRKRGRGRGGSEGVATQPVQKRSFFRLWLYQKSQVLITDPSSIHFIFHFSYPYFFQISVAVSSASDPRHAVERAGHALDWRGTLQSLGQ